MTNRVIKKGLSDPGKMDWKCGLCSRIPALGDQTPKFTLQSNQTKNERKKKKVCVSAPQHSHKEEKERRNV
jgi:hypothetical protein